MEKSVKNAFLYMFKDKDWDKQIGILTFLFFIIFAIFYKEISLIPLLATKNKEANLTMQAIRIITPIVTIITFFMLGYITKCTHNVINSTNQEIILLPDWNDDFFSYFVLGAKRAASKMGVFILLLPTILLLGIPFIIFGFLCIPLGRIFCTEFKFESYFKWKEGYELIKNNVGLYIWILIIMLILNLLSTLLVIVLLYFKIESSLSAIISAIITTYLSLVFAYLLGIVGEKLESES